MLHVISLQASDLMLSWDKTHAHGQNWKREPPTGCPAMTRIASNFAKCKEALGVQKTCTARITTPMESMPFAEMGSRRGICLGTIDAFVCSVSPGHTK